MKKFFFVFTTLLLYFNLMATPQLGVGGSLAFYPQPGATLKYWFNELKAVDGYASFTAGEDFSNLYIGSRYLIHDYNLVTMESGKMPVYWGVGPLLNFSHEGLSRFISLQIPLGVDYLDANKSFGVFVEITPTLSIFKDVSFYIGGALGVRIF